MSREDLLRELILTQFGSVAKFAEATDIPYTTIRNIFTRGIDGVGAGTVVKICKHLNVDVEAFMDGNYQLRPNSQKDRAWLEYVERKNKTVTIDSDGLDELDMKFISLLKQLSDQEKQMLVAQMEALIRLRER